MRLAQTVSAAAAILDAMSARPTINCAAMTARMSVGTVEPTGVIASSPRDNMIMPNDCRCRVDVSQPTVTYSAGA